ncbi:MAG: hypothetical protein K5945_04920 [Bacteroidaceae bacterium]|nr:hypothetical protein [Bacteroidaceae bacterium]
MLQGLKNDLFLWWWSSTKKVKGVKGLTLIRQYVTYGKGVTDLTWKLRYKNGRGKKDTARYISERANDWNLRSTIRQIEKERLPLEIEAIKESIAKRKQAEQADNNKKSL